MSRSFPADLASHVRSQLVSRKEQAPPLGVLTTLFETLYFASLKREESQPITCRIAFVDRKRPDPDPPSRVVPDRWQCFPLAHDLPLSVRNLVKLSSAVDPWGSTLAVDVDADRGLRIWGLIDQSVHYSTFMVREASTGPTMPGMFQAVIQGTGEIAAYRTRVFLGSLMQDVLVKRQQIVFQSGPVHSKLMRSIKTFQQQVRKRVGSDLYDQRGHWDASLEGLWISALCRILIGIQKYHHGGAVLISDDWSGLNAKYSLQYNRLSDALTRLATHQIKNASFSDVIHEKYLEENDDIPSDLYLHETVSRDELTDTNAEVTGCIRFLTSLSRIDGLIWVDSRLRLKGFGVEITSREDPPGAFSAQNSGATKTKALDMNHFGTRHRSMLRYCAASPNSVGFVVSQDGDVRAVSQYNNRLLLWDNIRIRSLKNSRIVPAE